MRLILCILFLATSCYSYGYSTDRAIANLSSDFATCSAYFGFMSNGLKASGQDDTKLKQIAAYSYQKGVSYSNEKVTIARVKLMYKQFQKDTDNNWSNAAIVIEQYGQMCKTLIEEPEKRLNYWIEKN